MNVILFPSTVNGALSSLYFFAELLEMEYAINFVASNPSGMSILTVVLPLIRAPVVVPLTVLL